MVLSDEEPVNITDSVLLIRISRLYYDGITEDELYDATRSCWRLGKRRTGVRFALAVYKGIVKEVYEIEGWHPGGATPCKSQNLIPMTADGINRSLRIPRQDGSPN